MTIYQTRHPRAWLFGRVEQWPQRLVSIGGVTVHGSVLSIFKVVGCPCKAFVARGSAFGEIAILANRTVGDAESYARLVAHSLRAR